MFLTKKRMYTHVSAMFSASKSKEVHVTHNQTHQRIHRSRNASLRVPRVRTACAVDPLGWWAPFENTQAENCTTRASTHRACKHVLQNNTTRSSKHLDTKSK